MMNLHLQGAGQYQPLMRALANGCAIKWYHCYLLDMHYLDCWHFLIQPFYHTPIGI